MFTEYPNDITDIHKNIKILTQRSKEVKNALTCVIKQSDEINKCIKLTRKNNSRFQKP